MLDSNRKERGFGTINASGDIAHRMLGFVLHREDISAGDADLNSVEPVIDLSRNRDGRNNTIMVVLHRKSGTGGFTAKLHALLPGPTEAASPIAPKPAVAEISTLDESGYIRVDDLPAAQFKILVESTGNGTWDIYVARSYEPFTT